MLIYLPRPVGLRYWFNLGSLLGIVVVIQIVSGWLITLIYTNHRDISFDRIWLLHLERWNGSLIHLIHINFSSFIFIIMYLHVVKGLYVQRWKFNKTVWLSGFVLFIIIMGISFVGYVLPFGQISLWGATVITNLISVISTKLVIFVWGGYSVTSLTLKVFFTLHFILPHVLLLILVGHLILLHTKGSSHFRTKESFWPIFVIKDLLNIVAIIIIMWWCIKIRYYFADAENFLKANPMLSPLHIKPEWYFLQYYAVLRSIPNKTVGVILFALRLVRLAMLRFRERMQNSVWSPWWSLRVSVFVVINILLVLCGNSPVQEPYFTASQILTLLYFMWVLFCVRGTNLWEMRESSKIK
jgi:ubiquinol-cytochrome c reductase cytochrome b subunit